MYHFTNTTCFLFLEQAETSLACLSCSDGIATAVHRSVTGFRSNNGLDGTNKHVCLCVCVCDVNDADLCHRRLATSTRSCN
jgi:hypothetical protein